MKYIIGIDGGGTKTVGLLATKDGQTIAKTQTGPSNYHVVGIEQTKNVLTEIISQLKLQVPNTDLDSILCCIGMAGLGREEDREIIGQICDEIGISKNRILTHDAHIGLVSGTGKQSGVIVISGTGSIVYGINEHGREVRAGGWGYILGDEGSGYDIAVKGLQAVARAADQREPATQITQLILKRLSLNEPNDLIRWTHAASRDEIAQMSDVMFTASDRGDTQATRIIDIAVGELVCAIETVVTQLEFTIPIDIVFSGGNLVNQPLYADKLRMLIEGRITDATVRYPKHEPVYGAVLLAMERL